MSTSRDLLIAEYRFLSAQNGFGATLEQRLRARARIDEIARLLTSPAPQESATAVSGPPAK